MFRMKKITKEKIIFFSILVIAALLRFWNYWEWSYTHDEIGALVRLNYLSFSEFIQKGVQNTDTHPAFTQIFILLWSKIVGLSEMAIRLPFILAGIGSVALTFHISKKWFGLTSAYFSSLTLAILNFPILYSQLARPYSFGLFFSLLTVLCWTHLLFGNNKKIIAVALAYAISTALCMLTHYFSFFFSMMVAATGFFFLKKETWKPYLLSGVIAFLIFLPHIPISIHQFSMGGVGEWLAKPETDYLWKFILYGFNDSSLVVILIFLLAILSLLLYSLKLPTLKFQVICLSWFLLPFIAGYYYSVMVNPVLQYSTLLFSFPFLIILMFSLFRDGKEKLNLILLTSTGIILLYSTLFEAKLYSKESFGVFKELNKKVIELQDKYGQKNITTYLNTSGKEIFDFYFKLNNKTIPYNFEVGDSPNFELNMLHHIDSCHTPYFLYSWSNFRSPYEIPEIIKRKYPCIIYDEKHFNSQLTLFGKNDSCKRDTLFYLHQGSEHGKLQFSFDSLRTDTLHFHWGNRSLEIEKTNEFCITIKTTIKKLFAGNLNCVNVSAWIFPKDTFNTQLIMDIGGLKGEHDWHSKPLYKFITNKNKWQEVFATFQLPPSAYPDDEVSIYLWNPGKNSFLLDDFTISSFLDSKYNYYEVSYRK